MAERADTSETKDVQAGRRHGPGMIGAEPAAGADAV